MADDLSGSPPGDRSADETAIRELVDRQVRGWDAGDPDAYAGVFNPDADYVTFLGTHHRGREAIAASYAPLFKKALKGSRLEVEITQLRFLTPDVALIQARARVVKGGGRRGGTRLNTTVAVRSDGEWQLAASHNTTHRRFAEKLMGLFVARHAGR